MKMGRYGYQSVEGAVDGSREVVSSQLFIIVDLLLYFRHIGLRGIGKFTRSEGTVSGDCAVDFYFNKLN